MNKFLSKLSSAFLRVPLSEKILFTKHLGMMTKSSMSTVESLNLIKRQVKSRSFRIILDKVTKEVENGQSLSTAFSQFRHVFGELFISIIALGEASGTLSENLEYLSNELKKSRQLHSKIRSAFVYPVIIMIFTVGVVVALVFFVLPRLTSIFSSLRVGLPITTKILIGFASIVQNYYYLIIGGVVFFIIAWTLLMKLPHFKYAIHRIILALPIVGNISKNYNMAGLTRTLGLLLKSGMKIVEAVNTTSGVLANVVYQKALIETVEEIKRGEPLYKYLEEHEHVFPLTVSHMIEVGEKTGNLDANLLYLAEFYENEVDETVKNLSSILEPLLLVFMGAIVGFVAISIITPIYQLSQGVK